MPFACTFWRGRQKQERENPRIDKLGGATRGKFCRLLRIVESEDGWFAVFRRQVEQAVFKAHVLWFG